MLVDIYLGVGKMELNLQEMLFDFFGGLGIFLFGVKFMGEGLQKSAGKRLRDVLDRFTTNPVMGVLAESAVVVVLDGHHGQVFFRDPVFMHVAVSNKGIDAGERHTCKALVFCVSCNTEPVPDSVGG